MKRSVKLMSFFILYFALWISVSGCDTSSSQDRDNPGDGDDDQSTDESDGDEEDLQPDGDADDEIPTLPVLGTSRAISAHNIVVEWQADAAAGLEIAIERRTGDAGAYQSIARRPASHGRYLDLALTPEQTYQYRIQSCNDTGCSEFVETALIATKQSKLTGVEITHAFEGDDTGEVMILNVQDYLDTEYIYAAMMAIKRDGTVIWSLQDIEDGVVSEIQPIEENRTLAAITLTASKIMDLDGSVLYRNDDDLAHHDIDLTADGKLIYLFWEQIMMNDDFPLLSDGIRIRDPQTNEVAWEWRIEDHVPFSDFCGQCINDVYWDIGHDWTHANALTFDEEEGAIYLNVRNLNRLYKIAYPSGEVEWIMGDGGDFGEGLWSHSHDPNFIEDGRMLIFDNGLHRPGKDYTRVIIVDYDGEAKTAEITWEYREDPDFFCLGYGNALLSSQGIMSCDGANGRVFEVDMDGNIVWEMINTTLLHIAYKVNIVDESFFTNWGAPTGD